MRHTKLDNTAISIQFLRRDLEKSRGHFGRAIQMEQQYSKALRNRDEPEIARLKRELDKFWDGFQQRGA